jgi:hypothetical protein
MSGAIALERCWNHTAREAVCRCPGCARFFCRECVTEHDARLLCAACVAGQVARPRRDSFVRRRLLGPAAATGGLVAAWTVYYGVARVLVEIARSVGEQRWHPR